MSRVWFWLVRKNFYLSSLNWCLLWKVNNCDKIHTFRQWRNVVKYKIDFVKYSDMIVSDNNNRTSFEKHLFYVSDVKPKIHVWKPNEPLPPVLTWLTWEEQKLPKGMRNRSHLVDLVLIYCSAGIIQLLES